MPIMRFKDNPDSYGPRGLVGDRGVREKGELVGVDLEMPVFARKLVREFEGVEAMIKPCASTIGDGVKVSVARDCPA